MPTGGLPVRGLQHADRLAVHPFECRRGIQCGPFENDMTNDTMAKAPNYWLFKSEPNVYSIQDLAEESRQTTTWEGVRNYQVRNMLRDDIRQGDGVLFYHSRIAPMCIAGTARVVREGYPDHFAFQPEHKYFDAKCDPDNPRWFMVDVKLDQIFDTPVTRQMLMEHKVTAAMKVMAKGSRLSITPVTAYEWKTVHKLAGAEVI